MAFLDGGEVVELALGVGLHGALTRLPASWAHLQTYAQMASTRVPRIRQLARESTATPNCSARRMQV